MANGKDSKDRSIGAVFQAQTSFRRGDLPRSIGRSVPGYKVYANPLEVVALPAPALEGGPSLWRVVGAAREDIPEGGRLGQAQLSCVLWTAAGLTRSRQRTHVAVKGLSGLETYLVARRVEDLMPGVYHYDPREHVLEQLSRDDPTERLADALLRRRDVDASAAALVVAGIPDRLADGAGARSWRYLHQQAGAAAQGALLAAVALDLVANYEPDFYDVELSRLLQVDGQSEVPLATVLLAR